MKQRHASYDDSNDRTIVQDIMYDVYGLEFSDGRKYKVDLLGKDFNIEVGRMDWTKHNPEGTLMACKQFRVEKRKMHFWELPQLGVRKPVNYIQLNHDMTEAIMWEDSDMVRYCATYEPINLFGGNGWDKDKNYFLPWPKKEASNLKYFKQYYDEQWCVADKFQPFKNGNGGKWLFTEQNAYNKQWDVNGNKVSEQYDSWGGR